MSFKHLPSTCRLLRPGGGDGRTGEGFANTSKVQVLVDLSSPGLTAFDPQPLSRRHQRLESKPMVAATTEPLDGDDTERAPKSRRFFIPRKDLTAQQEVEQAYDLC